MSADLRMVFEEAFDLEVHEFNVPEEDTVEKQALGDASLSPTGAAAGAQEEGSAPKDNTRHWDAPLTDKLIEKLNETQDFSDEEITRLVSWVKRHVRSDYFGNPKKDMQNYNALRPVERFVEHNFGGHGPREWTEIRELRSHLPRNFNGKAVHLFYFIVMRRKDFKFKVENHELLLKFVKPIVIPSPSFKTHYCVLRDTWKALSKRYDLAEILQSGAQDMFKLNRWQNMCPGEVYADDTSMISEEGNLTYDTCGYEFIEPIMHMVKKNADFGWTDNDGATFKEAFHVVWLEMPLLRVTRHKDTRGMLNLPRFMWVFAEDQTRYYDNYKTMESRYKELDQQYRVFDDVIPPDAAGVRPDIPGIYGATEIWALNKNFEWQKFLPMLCRMAIPIDHTKTKQEEFKRISKIAWDSYAEQEYKEQLERAALRGDDEDGKVPHKPINVIIISPPNKP